MFAVGVGVADLRPRLVAVGRIGVAIGNLLIGVRLRTRDADIGTAIVTDLPSHIGVGHRGLALVSEAPGDVLVDILLPGQAIRRNIGIRRVHPMARFMRQLSGRRCRVIRIDDDRLGCPIAVIAVAWHVRNCPPL